LSARTSRPWPSLLLVGPTGSGKTPLGDELERRGLHGRRCVHFDFGRNLRAIVSTSTGESALTGQELAAIRASLASGALFEARDMPMIVKVLSNFIKKNDLTTNSLLVLNGLPRHREQAGSLSGTVAVERVVLLEADASVIRERLRLDPGGDRASRADDAQAAVVRRLALFQLRTQPLLDFYITSGVPLSVIPVTARMSAGDMYEALDRAIGIG
jgi:adenylate kinase